MVDEQFLDSLYWKLNYIKSEICNNITFVLLKYKDKKIDSRTLVNKIKQDIFNEDLKKISNDQLLWDSIQYINYFQMINLGFKCIKINNKYCGFQQHLFIIPFWLLYIIPDDVNILVFDKNGEQIKINNKNISLQEENLFGYLK